MTDTELKTNGMQVLRHCLGLVDAARFVALMNRSNSDYTKWRQDLFQGMSGDEISRLATDFVESEGF